MNRKRISSAAQRWRYVIIDWITSSIAFFIFNQFRYIIMDLRFKGFSMASYLESPKMILEQIIIPFCLLGIYWLSGYYNEPFNKSRLQEFNTTVLTSLFNSIIIYLALLINDQLPSRTLSYELMVTLFGSLFICVYTGRLILTQSTIRKFEHHEWSFRTIIIGDSDAALDMASRLKHSQAKLGYNIIGYLPIDNEKSSTRNHPTISQDQFVKLCRNREVDQLLIVPERRSPEDKILMLLYKYFPMGIPIKIAPTSFSFLTSNIHLQDIHAEPFVDLTSPSMLSSEINIKRTIDVIASSIALLIGSPIYLGIALAIKLSSKGPVIYAQERIGYRQKPFNIYKFRSMRIDAEDDGPQLSSEDDSRVTLVGKFLRKYRLDELPQFWNVLKGDMSLVGPRPERAYFIDQIVKQAPYYTLVHQTKPGITSWGMVKFGYARTVEEMVERTRYDLIYLSNMSLLVDLKILIHTIKTIVMGEGM